MPGVAALVVAAGRGRRFGGPVLKQFLLLRGLPVLAHALRALAVPGVVDRLVVATPSDAVEWCRDEVVAPLKLPLPVTLLAGGAQRQASVRAALDHAEEADLVLVHDGVRPFVPRCDLEAVLAAARTHGAAIVGVPVRDTLKRADAQGRIQGTVPREGLWAALTPQAFRRDLLVRAHAAAPDAGATDDAALVERLGHPVVIVPGDRRNLKITGPEDLALAEALLARGA
jgi:2-C-methyl-D-erythritol 4-phosphate cytidylyltransferase